MYNPNPLPYSYKALEPFIDSQTMELHYDKHYRSYTDKFNQTVSKNPDFFTGKTIESILKDPAAIPDSIRQEILDFGGGYANHSFFWTCLSPNGGGAPMGPFMSQIKQDFSNFENFKQLFTQAAMSVFGSGWTWLVLNPNGSLAILNTPNQYSPLSIGKFPLLCIDLWEHAYYLKFQNRRAEYLEAIWNVINWDAVELRYEGAVKK
jgi:Fe-Mn family superoxide dismutase